MGSPPKKSRKEEGGGGKKNHRMCVLKGYLWESKKGKKGEKKENGCGMARGKGKEEEKEKQCRVEIVELTPHQLLNETPFFAVFSEIHTAMQYSRLSLFQLRPVCGVCIINYFVPDRCNSLPSIQRNIGSQILPFSSVPLSFFPLPPCFCISQNPRDETQPLCKITSSSSSSFSFFSPSSPTRQPFLMSFVKHTGEKREDRERGREEKGGRSHLLAAGGGKEKKEGEKDKN